MESSWFYWLESSCQRYWVFIYSNSQLFVIRLQWHWPWETSVTQGGVEEKAAGSEPPENNGQKPHLAAHKCFFPNLKFQFLSRMGLFHLSFEIHLFDNFRNNHLPRYQSYFTLTTVAIQNINFYSFQFTTLADNKALIFSRIIFAILADHFPLNVLFISSSI